MNFTFVQKSVYGKSLYYPTDETMAALMRQLGAKTLTHQALAILKLFNNSAIDSQGAVITSL